MNPISELIDLMKELLKEIRQMKEILKNGPIGK